MGYRVRLVLVVCVALTTALMVVSCASPAKEHLNTGNEHFEQGQYDEAIVEYTKAIELEPQLAIVYNSRGLAYHMKGELDKAIADFDKAIELDPSRAEVYYNRGNVYFERGQFQSAIADYDKAIVLDPRFTLA